MEFKRLGDVATFVNGFAFKSEHWQENGLPIIRIQNLTKSDGTMNYFKGDIDRKYIVNNGDILIAWSASLGVHEWNGEQAVLNQHIFKVVFDKVEVNKSYFKYMVSQALITATKFLHGSTMKHLTKKYFDDIEIPFPSLKIQQKIGEVLDKANGLISKRQSQIKAFEELTQSLFLEMFGDPVINPQNLTKKKLGETGELKRGMSKHRPRNAPELLNGPYPLIQTGDVSRAGLFIESFTSTYSELGLKQSKIWGAGTLCITIAANIAQTSILKIDACFPDSVVGYKPFEGMNTIFVHYWFSFFQKILENSAPESAQKNINLKILNDIEVITPSIEEQNEFACKVQKIYENKLKLEEAKLVTEGMYSSLLQKAFKGELFQDQP